MPKHRFSARLFLRTGIVFCAFAVLASGPRIEAKKTQYFIKLGTIIPATSVWGQVSKKFERSINERCEGVVELKVFYGGSLGDEVGIMDQLRLGAIQAAAVTTGGLALAVPEAEAFELPFLFRDIEEARHLTDATLGPMLAEAAGRKGFHAQAIAENGFANFIAKGPIRTPEDLKGRKFASSPGEMQLQFWKSLGAGPVPMPLTEIFQAMQRGVVDGADNSILAIMAFNLHSKKKWITLSQHRYQPGVVLMNDKFWKTIPPKHQTILSEENANLARSVREALSKEEGRAREFLKTAGVKYHEWTPEEREVFVERTKNIYEEFEPVIGKKNMKALLEARDAWRKKTRR